MLDYIFTVRTTFEGCKFTVHFSKVCKFENLQRAGIEPLRCVTLGAVGMLRLGIGSKSNSEPSDPP